MLPVEITTLLRHHGMFTVADAQRLGVRAVHIRRLVASGELTRIGRGAYTSKQRLDEADQWDELAIRTRGFVAACATEVYASAAAAVAVRGLRRLGEPPKLPEVIAPRRARSGSVKTRYGLIRHADLPAPHRKDYAGCPVVSKTFAAMDYARTAPVPVSNAWVGRRNPEFRVDHLWREHWVVAEADGAVKYRDQEDPAAVIAEEKERQWLLERTLGFTVVRYGWDLGFGDRTELASRFRAVLADNPPRPTPVPWWPDYVFQQDPIVD